MVRIWIGTMTGSPASDRPETKKAPQMRRFLLPMRSGSAGRIRTYDQPINSRLLYH